MKRTGGNMSDAKAAAPTSPNTEETKSFWSVEAHSGAGYMTFSGIFMAF
jgi:hypothetical protein